ncbi:MAG: hypothetical protein QOF55_1247, partial [Thermoleophilaceae bacterium]|nr:hypothetical protein [Thermoleophilaceae bacterium]
MSTVALRAKPAAAPAADAAAEPRVRLELPLRLIAFFALAMFCAAHYSVLVVDTNGTRVLGLVLVATAGGAALALTRPVRGFPGLALRIALALGVL